MRITSTDNVVRPLTLPESQGKSLKEVSGGFADELKAKLMEVDQIQHQADKAMRQGAVEGADKIHETMIQLEEADISMRVMMRVRDKALSAYQEVMRMQF